MEACGFAGATRSRQSSIHALTWSGIRMTRSTRRVPPRPPPPPLPGSSVTGVKVSMSASRGKLVVTLSAVAAAIVVLVAAVVVVRDRAAKEAAQGDYARQRFRDLRAIRLRASDRAQVPL